jgi:hypothetical protein
MRHKAIAIAVAAGMSSGIAGAQESITALVVQGDNVAGVGNVTTIDNLAVNNSGQWIVEADTDHPNTNEDQVLIKNGQLFLRQGQALAAPAGTTISSFDSVNLNSAGHSGWNFFLGGNVTSSTDSGIFFDDVLVFQESHISTSPSFSPGTPYIGFFEVKINDSNQMLIIASVDDPNIPTTVDRALVRLDYDAGTGAFTEHVIIKEGDLPPGMAGGMTDMLTAPQNFDLNNAGDAIYVPRTGTTDYVYRNLELLAGEGLESPIPGRQWANLGAASVGINNHGDYVYTGQLTGNTATDLVIIRNGAVYRQEGDEAPGFPGLIIEGFGTSRIVDIADNGSVVWFADTNASTDIDGILYVNETPVLREGTTVVQTTFGSLTVATINNGQDAFAMSPNGRYVIAEVVLTDGATNRQAVLLIDMGEPAPTCYPNCDGSTTAPILNVADFTCFLSKFAAGDPYANCDGSTTEPILNVADFTCFLSKFAAGCP